MAPFPWHFGGQRYQNLFVHADECRYWCDKLNLRMCFDISHSRLMSNHFGVDFYDFAEKMRKNNVWIIRSGIFGTLVGLIIALFELYIAMYGVNIGTDSPFVVELDPTTVCDLACPGCISGDLLNQKNTY